MKIEFFCNFRKSENFPIFHHPVCFIDSTILHELYIKSCPIRRIRELPSSSSCNEIRIINKGFYGVDGPPLTPTTTATAVFLYLFGGWQGWTRHVNASLQKVTQTTIFSVFSRLLVWLELVTTSLERLNLHKKYPVLKVASPAANTTTARTREADTRLKCHQFLMNKQVDKQTEGTLQAFITNILSERRIKLLDERPLPMKIVWRTSVKNAETGMFLQALPKQTRLQLSNNQFCTALRFRYQFATLGYCPGTQCTCSNTSFTVSPDPWGHHIITGCNKNGSNRIGFHNTVVQAFNSCLKYCGFWTKVEDCPFQGDTYNKSRPDISVKNPIHSGKNELFLDISIATPYANIQKGTKLHPPKNTSTHHVDLPLCKLALRAAQNRFRDKMSKYANAMQTRPDAEFLPIVFETSGAMHPAATSLLKTYAKHAAGIQKIPHDILYNYFLKLISVAFNRSLADSLNQRWHVLRAKGNIEIDHPEFQLNNILDQTISNW